MNTRGVKDQSSASSQKKVTSTINVAVKNTGTTKQENPKVTPTGAGESSSTEVSKKGGPTSNKGQQSASTSLLKSKQPSDKGAKTTAAERGKTEGA